MLCSSVWYARFDWLYFHMVKYEIVPLLSSCCNSRDVNKLQFSLGIECHQVLRLRTGGVSDTYSKVHLLVQETDCILRCVICPSNGSISQVWGTFNVVIKFTLLSLFEDNVTHKTQHAILIYLTYMKLEILIWTCYI